jgi:arginine repressor
MHADPLAELNGLIRETENVVEQQRQLLVDLKAKDCDITDARLADRMLRALELL